MNYTQNKKIEQVLESTISIGVDAGSEINFAGAFDWRGIELTKKVTRFGNDKVIRFGNDNDGFQASTEWMNCLLKRTAESELIVGCEPAGHYWFPLAGYLKKQGIKLVMVNPYHVKQLKELDDNSPEKTDLKDPKTIAKLVVDGRYSEPYLPEGIYAGLREAVSSRDRIVKEMNRISNQIQRWLKIYFPEYLRVYRRMKTVLRYRNE